MRIDLTSSGRLTPSLAKQLNATADRARAFYNDMISRLAIGKEDDLDWWVSGLAGRNTYVCELFLECCYVVLVRELLITGELSEIVVGSKPLGKTIRSVSQDLGVPIKITVQDDLLEPIGNILLCLLDCLRDIVRQIYRTWLCRTILPSRRGPLPDNFTLVELFVLDGSFDKGHFKDRYYENFGGILCNEKEKGIVFFANLSVRFKNLHRIMRSLRSARQRFLIQEEILKTSDFAYAWSYPLRSIRHFPRQALLDGIDVTPLVRRAWWKHLFSSRSIEAVLKFRFIKRLKDYGVSLRHVIDWFENQDMDKAFNMGLRRFFPETTVVGYQGFDTQKYFLCAYPIEIERTSGVLPHAVAVCGPKLVAERKRFCRDLQVETAPAFRYMNLWKEGGKKTEAPFFRVLIILPLETQSATDILQLAIETVVSCDMENIRFLLKPHPALRLDTICDHKHSLPSALRIVEGDISQYWEQVDLIMGNTSSALLEGAAMGIPVIIVGSLHGITNNPIPETLAKDIWRLAFTKEEVLSSLRFFMSCSSEDKQRFVEMGREIREGYFSPTTRASVLRLFRISENCCH